MLQLLSQFPNQHQWHRLQSKHLSSSRQHLQLKPGSSLGSRSCLAATRRLWLLLSQRQILSHRPVSLRTGPRATASVVMVVAARRAPKDAEIAVTVVIAHNAVDEAGVVDAVIAHVNALTAWLCRRRLRSMVVQRQRWTHPATNSAQNVRHAPNVVNSVHVVSVQNVAKAEVEVIGLSQRSAASTTPRHVRMRQQATQPSALRVQLSLAAMAAVSVAHARAVAGSRPPRQSSPPN